MKTEVPLWGFFLTGFTMLFAVAYQSLGFMGAAEFTIFLETWVIWFLANTLLILAVLVNLTVFNDGFARVSDDRYEWYFLNTLGLSARFMVVGFIGRVFAFFSATSWQSGPFAVSDIVSTWAIFWKAYIFAIVISFAWRTIRGDWMPD